jgi:hypothetical protein
MFIQKFSCGAVFPHRGKCENLWYKIQIEKYPQVVYSLRATEFLRATVPTSLRASSLPTHRGMQEPGTLFFSENKN